MPKRHISSLQLLGFVQKTIFLTGSVFILSFFLSVFLFSSSHRTSVFLPSMFWNCACHPFDFPFPFISSLILSFSLLPLLSFFPSLFFVTQNFPAWNFLQESIRIFDENESTRKNFGRRLANKCTNTKISPPLLLRFFQKEPFFSRPPTLLLCQTRTIFAAYRISS